MSFFRGCRPSGLLIAALVGSGVILTAQLRGPAPGEPLPGVTPAEFEEFRLGLDDFLEVETTEEGLGPAFNGTSCAACHNVPAIGGAGTIAEVRAGRRDALRDHQATTAMKTFQPKRSSCASCLRDKPLLLITP